MRWRGLAALLLLASCATAAPPSATRSSYPVTTVAPVTATAVPSRSPYPVFTVAPGSDSPVGRLEVVRVSLRKWTTYGRRHGQLIAEIKNAGTVTLGLENMDHRWSIADKDGVVIAAGGYMSTTHLTLDAGKTGYLWVDVDFPHASFKELVQLDVMPLWAEVEPEPQGVRVSGVRIGRADYSSGLEATGRLTNKSDSEISVSRVAVVFLDAKGRPLGIVSDADPHVLAPGESSGFQTDSVSPPLKRAKVKKMRAFAV